MAEKLTPRQAAEAIEQFGDDLAKLLNDFERLACNRMSFETIVRINAIPDMNAAQSAEAFRALGDALCRELDEAEDIAR